MAIRATGRPVAKEMVRAVLVVATELAVEGTGGGAGPIGGGGAPIGGGQIAALSGQNIGAGGAGANVVGQFAGAQN